MDKQTDSWNKFKQMELLLDRIESSGLKSLDSDQVLLFGRLYRQVVAALSRARTQGVHDPQIEYLNRLASRAYGHIYISEPKGWPSVRSFFKEEFPQSFRRNLLFVVAAFTITIVAALFAYGMVASDPGTADVILGPNATATMESIAERHTGHKNWMPEEMRPMMSSFIMANNIKVTILAFATGILLCIGTFLVLFYNGLMLGVVGAAIAAHSPQVGISFWGFVAPHGVIELTAIFIAGGAGLMLGWAILSPGEYTRGTALKLAGREALKLMLGVAAMLVIAGIIEGFFSPSMLPESLKFVVAAMLGIVEFSYLFLAGKKPPDTRHLSS